MRYKVTRQFAYATEMLCATFCELVHAQLFIKKITEHELPLDKKPVYWLFDQEQLLNKAPPSCHLSSRYGKGGLPLAAAIEQPFNIIIYHANQALIMASFSHLNDAQLFVISQLACDADNHLNITYFIFDGDQLLEQYNQEQLARLNAQKQTTPVFRPTPFATAPRLGPSHWLIDEEDQDKKH